MELAAAALLDCSLCSSGVAQILALAIMASREEVEAAVRAGRGMMRVEKTLEDGTKVFTHPLRFKVSEAWF